MPCSPINMANNVGFETRVASWGCKEQTTSMQEYSEHKNDSRIAESVKEHV